MATTLPNAAFKGRSSEKFTNPTIPSTMAALNFSMQPPGMDHLYETRKIINELVENAKINMNNLHTSEQAFQKAVESRLEWAGPVCEDLFVATKDFVATITDVLDLSFTTVATYRHLQLALNKQRKMLQVVGIQNMPCWSKRHFLQEITALFEVIQFNILDSFHHRSQAILESHKNRKIVYRNGASQFWIRAGKSNRRVLLRNDKTVALLSDVMKAREHHDSLDSLLEFSEHMKQHPSESDRFEPSTYDIITAQIGLYIRLTDCADTISGGRLCLDHPICKELHCGLHGMNSRVRSQGYLFYGFQSRAFHDLMADVFIPLYLESRRLAPHSRLIKVLTEEIRTRRQSFGVEDIVTVELLELLESYACPVHTQGPGPDPSGRPLNSEKAKKPSTTSPDPITPGYKEADASIRRPDASEGCLSTTSGEVAAEVNAKTITPISEPLSEPKDVSSVTIEDARLSPKPQRRKSRDVPPSDVADRMKTISKYHSRGYGQLSPGLNSPNNSNIQTEQLHTRTWHVEDPTFYYEVWRVIFPQTRSDRQVNRVSWPLFYRAMQSPPVNCRVKRARDPEYVFERRNSDTTGGGKEICECHAPHSGTWIPASDLYRYRTDLRNTFGMDADRIFLVEKREKSSWEGSCCGH